MAALPNPLDALLYGVRVIQDDGTPLPTRGVLNVIGATLADNPTTKATDLTIASGTVTLATLPPVADLAALDAIVVGALPNGATVVVQTTGDPWELGALRTASGAGAFQRVRTAAGGGRSWSRGHGSDSRWTQMPDVYIDASAGDDEAAGTFGAPLKTLEEWAWRIANGPLLVQPTVHLVTDITYPGPLPTTVADGSGVIYQGVRTSVASDVVATFQPYVGTPGAVQPSLLTSQSDFSTHVGRLIVFDAQNAYAVILAADAIPLDTIPPTYVCTLSPLAYMPPSYAGTDPSGGDAFEICTMTQLTLAAGGQLVPELVTFRDLHLSAFGVAGQIYVESSRFLDSPLLSGGGTGGGLVYGCAFDAGATLYNVGAFACGGTGDFVALEGVVRAYDVVIEAGTVTARDGGAIIVHAGASLCLHGPTGVAITLIRQSRLQGNGHVWFDDFQGGGGTGIQIDSGSSADMASVPEAINTAPVVEVKLGNSRTTLFNLSLRADDIDARYVAPEPATEPWTLATCTSWLEADSDVRRLAGGIYEWDELGATGNDYVQATSNLRPTLTLRDSDFLNRSTIRTDGSLTNLQSALNADGMLAVDEYTLFVVLAVDGAPAAAGNVYDRGCVFGDAGYFGMYADATPQLIAYNWDGGNDNVAAPITLGAPMMVVQKHDAGNLTIQVGGGTVYTVASGDTQALAASAHVGKNSGAVEARVALVATFIGLTAPQEAEVRAYIAAKYGVST